MPPTVTAGQAQRAEDSAGEGGGESGDREPAEIGEPVQREDPSQAPHVVEPAPGEEHEDEDLRDVRHGEDQGGVRRGACDDVDEVGRDGESDGVAGPGATVAGAEPERGHAGRGPDQAERVLVDDGGAAEQPGRHEGGRGQDDAQRPAQGRREGAGRKGAIHV